ncbi:MAG TPA: HPr(Ser) kinase/phosphatase [Calditrichia bacterium]|nr:HPr(Ser) kinase/phosphatase [Calditrichota bacterium]HQU74732.1 HPr(Ser) kinase/phosphatase [Calditrichia bacterium]HQV32860.1 HPr(Ser) kinase/phosphatase [Calditrichia bacterium]
MAEATLDVGKLYRDTREKLRLELVTSNAGFDRRIDESDWHRPGLALAGFIDLFTYSRVQVLGNTEIHYLSSLDDARRLEALERVLQFDLPCIFITDDNQVPEELLKIATRRYIPVFRSNYATTIFLHILSDYLQHIFAPKTNVHGTLVDVYGIGLLFTGSSGVGKSEIALDLVERGHRLVADDMVIITKKGEEILMGEGQEISEHLIEVRGLGLIDIRQIFGIRAVRVHKRIEAEVRLVTFDPGTDYDRTGLDEQKTEFLGVKIPLVVLPINPGKNITVIAETIALNQLLKEVHGHHTPREFNRRLMERMQRQERTYLRQLKTRGFLDKDFE